MSQKVDVFIAGSGSAGLCAATWLSLCLPHASTSIKIVDSRSSPLDIGKADGVQCRTVEIFDSFNIAEELLRESYHVIEDAFWENDGKKVGGIERVRRNGDTERGLSYMPHVILNQARINGLLIEKMREYGGVEVDYGVEVKSVVVDGEGDGEGYPVTVVTERDGKEELYKAKYVLGCDGAHSVVRKSLGFKMIGDSTNAVWGVMDIYPQTNFPDIRLKAIIRSSSGSLLIIPREGGSLVRFYIELPSGTSTKSVTLEDLQARARLIFQPYKMEFSGTYWWSAYSIGQRLADHFSKDNRVFLTGDACHTHSPKAGQGMNVSLQDGYNIGWKLAAVLKGQSPPSLLKTYNLEREKVASDLIDFDRKFAKAFSSNTSNGNGNFSDLFIEAGRFTAGLGTMYSDSIITKRSVSLDQLPKNLQVGMRFPSTQVVRFCDAKAMQLVKALPSDGRWRIVVFAGDISKSGLAKFCEKLADYLSSEDGPVRKYTPKGQDIDSFIEPLLLLQGKRENIGQEKIPGYFWPVTGKWKVRDLHKTFVDEESYNHGHGKAYEFYGVEPGETGIAVIVRPDQYISMITTADDHDGIGAFFDDFLIPLKEV